MPHIFGPNSTMATNVLRSASVKLILQHATLINTSGLWISDAGKSSVHRSASGPPALSVTTAFILNTIVAAKFRRSDKDGCSGSCSIIGITSALSNLYSWIRSYSRCACANPSHVTTISYADVGKYQRTKMGGLSAR